jgi:hypothetical protein
MMVGGLVCWLEAGAKVAKRWAATRSLKMRQSCLDGAQWWGAFRGLFLFIDKGSLLNPAARWCNINPNPIKLLSLRPSTRPSWI